jgi:hypothetical protein
VTLVDIAVHDSATHKPLGFYFEGVSGSRDRGLRIQFGFQRPRSKRVLVHLNAIYVTGSRIPPTSNLDATIRLGRRHRVP